MEIAAGLCYMIYPRKPDMLMVSTRGWYSTKNVKNAGSMKLPSTALPGQHKETFHSETGIY
jgi:hypothetical protein